MQFADDVAASRIVLADGRVLTKCDQCRETYGERTPPGIPPCGNCRVELYPENEDAAEVYFSTRNQVVTVGQGRVVDINIQAVKVMMDLQGIRDQLECLEKVRNLFYHFLNHEASDEN